MKEKHLFSKCMPPVRSSAFSGVHHVPNALFITCNLGLFNGEPELKTVWNNLDPKFQIFAILFFFNTWFVHIYMTFLVTHSTEYWESILIQGSPTPRPQTAPQSRDKWQASQRSFTRVCSCSASLTLPAGLRLPSVQRQQRVCNALESSPSPLPLPSAFGRWKHCLPWNWSLVPKTLGPSDTEQKYRYNIVKLLRMDWFLSERAILERFPEISLCLYG